MHCRCLTHNERCIIIHRRKVEERCRQLETRKQLAVAYYSGKEHVLFAESALTGVTLYRLGIVPHTDDNRAIRHSSLLEQSTAVNDESEIFMPYLLTDKKNDRLIVRYPKMLDRSFLQLFCVLRVRKIGAVLGQMYRSGIAVRTERLRCAVANRPYLVRTLEEAHYATDFAASD